MSTKAYDFYIFEYKNLKNFLKWAEKEIKEATWKHINKNTTLKQLFYNYDWKIERDLTNRILDSSGSMRYSFEGFDLYCGVSIWFWNNNVVVKLFGLSEFKYDCKRPKYMKNFEYWNNTDKPENISNLEWIRRKRFFDTTIEEIQRIEYRPLDFQTEFGILKSLSELRWYHKEKSKEVSAE